jgi:hypothetical protein
MRRGFFARPVAGGGHFFVKKLREQVAIFSINACF